MPVADVAHRMLDTYPRTLRVSRDELVACIEACHDCATSCTQCADDCLSEDGHQQMLAKCIRLNLDCADICAVTGRVVSRQTDYDANVTRAVAEACAAACRSCADECSQHTDHEHCQMCAHECERCRQACERLLAAIG